jgi:hypothetical protein
MQNAMNIKSVQDFLVILCDLTSFVRNPPKRLAIFQYLQENDSMAEEDYNADHHHHRATPL